jgi:lactate dehydrogenase-like 2-hydroxyacid dehydrogenase
MTLAVITDYMGDDTSLERELLEDEGIEVLVSASPHPLDWLHYAERADARAYDPYLPSLPSEIERADSIADLVAGAHVLSPHAPLTLETRAAIGAAELAALTPGAIVAVIAGDAPKHPVSVPAVVS